MPERKAETYTVGFEVKDGKNLRSSKEDGVNCRPWVVVTCCGKKHEGKLMPEQPVTQVSFGESNIWSDVVLEPDQYETAFIEFAVYSRNFFTRNYLIGKASLQLAFINKRDGHLFRSKPVNLKREDSADTTGILTVTCFALKPGESVINWKDAGSADKDEEGDAEELVDPESIAKNVLGARIERDENSKPYHIFINIHRVEHLAQRNFKSLSPFVTVEFAGHRVKVPCAQEVTSYAWNAACKIPIQTPIYEETILVKLWHNPSPGGLGKLLHSPLDALEEARSVLRPDELLAQGLISFNGLRNKPMPPRWFCMYGWNPDEVPQEGFGDVVPEPNYFIGQLLISGRVKAVDPEDLASTAEIDLAARPPDDPPSVQTSLLADVHEVHGVIGRACQVEVQFTGLVSRETESVTKWVNPDKYQRESPQPQHSRKKPQEPETITSFVFDAEHGRISSQLAMVPEDVASQPKVMINVYTKGVLSGARRVAYCFRSMSDFPIFVLGQTPKPRYYALTTLPGAERQSAPPSVLMSLERAPNELILDDRRNERKVLYHSVYILRAYIFMARSIKGRAPTDKVEVRVTCAGMATSTDPCKKNEVRPMWMIPLDLRISLVSEHPKEPPSMEPIVVSILIPGERVLGKTTCIYEYMRRKNNMGEWEPYKLQPQWIKVFGGNFDQKVAGEVLIAFELLNAKNEFDTVSASSDQRALPVQDMWPSLITKRNKNEKRWSELKKATLHVALYGVRDIVSKGGSMDDFKRGGGLPKVTFAIKRFEEIKSGEAPRYKLTFKLTKSGDGGHPKVEVEKIEATQDTKTYEINTRKEEAEEIPEDQSVSGLKEWESITGLGDEAKNYEFFSVKKFKIVLPKNTLLEPFVSVRVEEQFDPTNVLKYAANVVGKGMRKLTSTPEDTSDDKLVGEHRMSLCRHLPCNWYDWEIPDEVRSQLGTDPGPEKFTESSSIIGQTIQNSINKAIKARGARDVFQEETQEEREEWIQKESQGGHGGAKVKQDLLIEQREIVDSSAMPYQFAGVVPGNWNNLVDLLYPKNAGGGGGAAAAAAGGEKSSGDRDRKAIDKQLQEEKGERKKYPGLETFQERLKTIAFPMDTRACDTHLNMCMVKTFKEQDGLPAQAGQDGAAGRAQLLGSLERPTFPDDFEKWKKDFHFMRLPLLRDHDLFEDDDDDADDAKTDWAFSPECCGFVKFALQLTDGWPDENDDEEDSEEDEEHGSSSEEEEDPMPAIGVSAGGAGAWLASEKQASENNAQLALVGPAAKVPQSAAKNKDVIKWTDFHTMSDSHLKRYFDDNVAKSKDRAKGLEGFRRKLKVRVRIYFVRGVCTYADEDGSTNPYLTYMLGRTETSMKNMVKLNNPTPDFYRVEERDIDMPEQAMLTVKMMDMGDGSVDNVIGATCIDLEDRWYSKNWNEAMKKGSVCRETRSMTSQDDPTTNNGSLEMWVEMIQTSLLSSGEHKVSALAPQPPVVIEMRIVIWGTKDVKNVDGNHSDVKIYGTLSVDDGKYGGEVEGAPPTQETDVHYGCQDGEAEFNWRMIFKKIEMPTDNCTLTFKCVDYNNLSGDTYIGSVSIDVKKYAMKVMREGDSLRIEKAEVTLRDEEKEDDDEEANSGSMKWELFVLTSSEAASRPQGMARQEPNDDPPLSVPTKGRSWGDALGGLAFDFSGFDTALLKKLLPVIIFALLCLVLLRWLGLL